MSVVSEFNKAIWPSVRAYINRRISTAIEGIEVTGGSDGISTSSTDTLTNKTISGSSNTLSNISVGSIVGLSAVATDNSYTSLSNKPTIPTVPSTVSSFTNDAGYQTASQVTTAVSSKESIVTAGTTAQYYRGDKSFQTLTQDVVPDGTTNKAFTATMLAKLAAIATGATANATDAFLLARANHTGTQAISTVTGLQTALDSKQALLGYTPVPDTRTITVNGTSQPLSSNVNFTVSAGGSSQYSNSTFTQTDLQTLITNAPANTQLNLAPGTYNLTSSLLIQAKQGLTVNGNWQVTFTGSISTMVTLSGAINKLRLTGIRFVSTSTSTTEVDGMITTDQSISGDSYELDHCYFTGPTGNFNAHSWVPVSGLNGGATNTNVFKNINIHHNIIENMGRCGIELLNQRLDVYRVLGLTISDNYISTCGINNTYGMGISLSGAMEGVTIESNKIYESKFYSIEVINCRNVSISSNIVKSTVAGCAGISVNAQGDNNGNNVVNELVSVVGNQVRTRYSPVQMSDVNNVTITGNTLLNENSSDISNGGVRLVRVNKGSFTGNTVNSSSYNALTLNISSQLIIEGNFLSNKLMTTGGTSYQVVWLYFTGTTGNTVRNNIYEKNSGQTQAQGFVFESDGATANTIGDVVIPTTISSFTNDSGYLTATTVLAVPITGYTSGSGTVAATDTIVQAVQKLNGNDALKATLASPTFTGTPIAPTAAGGTNTTQIATTSFVQTALTQSQWSATDAAYTIIQFYSTTKLITITANRIVTLPSATNTGKRIQIINQNGSAFTWNLSGTVKDVTGTTITSLNNLTTYILEADGTNWNIIAISPSVAALTATNTPGVGMGTSPSAISTSSTTINGGLLSFTTGTSPTAGTIITVNFGTTYSQTPKVILERYSDTAITTNTLYRIGTITASSFTLINTNTNTLTASSVYSFAYHVFL